MSASATLEPEQPSRPEAGPPEARGTPFKFLAYYEEKDSAAFGGRDVDVHAIAEAATYARTLVLYGKSGLGKTSILLAGVFPELRARGALPIHVRTLRDPVEDVRAMITVRGPASAAEGKPGETLVELLRRCSSIQPLVLVFDQFEEFFIRFRDRKDAYDAFVRALAAIVRDGESRVHLIFSLREEYLADLDDLRTQLPGLFEYEHRLRPMTAFGVREAITRPLEAQGVAYDPRLVSRLVDELSTKRFDSIVLQILCQEVFDHARSREGQLQLTPDDLRQTTDIEVVFRRYLDATANALPREVHLHARIVLHALMTQEHTKQAMRLSDFNGALYRLDDAEVKGILQVLHKHRLVRVDPRGGEDWYELTHERLTPILEQWLRLDTEFNALMFAHDLVATPARNPLWRSVHDSLLSSEWLSSVVGRFKGRLVLRLEEAEFVLWSAIYQRHVDVTFWANQRGVDASRGLVLDLLRADDTQLRMGAAFAAGRIGRDHDDTRLALLRTALHDPNSNVRREAARAFHGVRDAKSEVGLRAALLLPETREHALSALAEMHACGDLLRGYPLWTRWRARKLAVTRLRVEHIVVLADAGKTALSSVPLSSLAWTLTVAAVYGSLASFQVAATDAEPIWAILLVALLSSFIATLGFGALLSYFAARSAALLSLVPGTKSWASAVRWNPGYLVVLAVWTGAWALLYGILALKGEDVTETTPLILCLLPAAYWWILPTVIGFSERGATAGGSPIRIRVQAATASAGLPLLLPGAVALLSAQNSGDAWSAARGVSVVAAPLMSGLTAVLATALREVFVKHGAKLGGDRAERARHWGRFAHGGLAALALMGTLACLGPGVIPWRASSGTLGPRPGASLSLSAHFSDTSWTRVEYRRFFADGDVLAKVEATGSPSFVLDGERLSADSTVVLWRGGHRFAFTDSAEGQSTLWFSAERVLPMGAADVDKDGKTPVWLEWRRSGDALVAEIAGKAAPGSLTVALGRELFVPGHEALQVDVLMHDGTEEKPAYFAFVTSGWTSWTTMGSDSDFNVPVGPDGTFHASLSLTYSSRLLMPATARSLAVLTR